MAVPLIIPSRSRVCVCFRETCVACIRNKVDREMSKFQSKRTLSPATDPAVYVSILCTNSPTLRYEKPSWIIRRVYYFVVIKRTLPGASGRKGVVRRHRARCRPIIPHSRVYARFITWNNLPGYKFYYRS